MDIESRLLFLLTGRSVKASNAKDVGRAALRVGVQAAARVAAAGSDISGGSHGGGEEGGESEELHFGCVGRKVD